MASGRVASGRGDLSPQSQTDICVICLRGDTGAGAGGDPRAAVSGDPKIA